MLAEAEQMQFKLAPAFATYMVARHRLLFPTYSTTGADSRSRLQAFLNKAVTCCCMASKVGRALSDISQTLPTQTAFRRNFVFGGIMLSTNACSCTLTSNRFVIILYILYWSIELCSFMYRNYRCKPWSEDVFFIIISEKIFSNYSSIFQSSQSEGLLVYWLANASELLNFVKQDIELDKLTRGESQQLLAKTIESTYGMLSSMIKNHLLVALKSFRDSTLDDRAASRESFSRTETRSSGYFSNKAEKKGLCSHYIHCKHIRH